MYSYNNKSSGYGNYNNNRYGGGYNNNNNNNNYNNNKKGSTSKLESLFKKSYADKEDKEIMSEEGMLKFFKDCGVNPESYQTLVIAYLLQCEEMGIYEKDEFVKGFADLGMI